NSVEISQITVFNQICGIRCEYLYLEITYGLENRSCLLQPVLKVLKVLFLIYPNVSNSFIFFNKRLKGFK
ncbi:MAG: glycine--tRNA ligase subunit alpha, partial [Candidatus Hodgkinia cicadicola]